MQGGFGRRRARWARLLIGAAWLLLPLGEGAAAEGADKMPWQLFTSVDQRVVAVGESLVLTADLYATPSTAAARLRLASACAEVRLEGGHEAVTVVSTEPPALRDAEEGVTVCTRRYTLRASAPGAVDLPAPVVRLSPAPHQAAPQRILVYQAGLGFFRTARSILPIITEQRPAGGQKTIVRNGTAFLAREDALVTSFHVVMDADRVRVRLPSGRWVRLRKAWVVDPTRDVVVLYLPPKHAVREGLKPLALAPSLGSVGPPRAGEAPVAFTYGWPGGIQRSTGGQHFPHLTLDPSEAIWVSANPVRPGDSGGPLLDRHGRVLGVISSGSVHARSPQALREEVCIATDPRPALGRRLLVARPRSLRRLLSERALRHAPYAHALRLSTQLAMPRAARRADLKRSLERLSAGLAATPHDASLRFMRGAIYDNLGARAQAAADYQRAFDQYAWHFPAAYMLAQHHLNTRDYRAAAALFEHVARRAPYRHVASYGLAKASLRRLRYDDAERALRTVVHYDASYAPALFDLARVHLAEGDEALARQVLVRLGEQHGAWARALRRVLGRPALHPIVPASLPRAPLRLEEGGVCEETHAECTWNSVAVR